MIVVVAWADTKSVWDGRPFAHDLGERPSMVEALVAHAAVWVNNGDDADVERAKVWASRFQGARVYTFGADEGDPLGAAKARILNERG